MDTAALMERENTFPIARTDQYQFGGLSFDHISMTTAGRCSMGVASVVTVDWTKLNPRAPS